MDTSKTNQRIWVSGASSGIGAEIARQLSAEGCRLALFARRGEQLESLRLTLSNPEEVIVHAGDVSDRDAVHRSIESTIEAFGGLDVIYLNAGFGDSFFPERFDADLCRRITEVNYLGALYGIESVMPHFLKRGTGTIVGISSIAGTRGMPGAAPYCASKAAFTTFLESLRIDLTGRNIQVTTVNPGFVRTPLTDRNRFPMPFRLDVEPAVRRILRGVRRGKREVHFPRRLTLLVKTLGLLPGPLYDFVMRRFGRKKYDKAPS
ncbi:MAG: SDR family NAD(P)-dependent oxidoreductase [Planctomycetota bacterium]